MTVTVADTDFHFFGIRWVIMSLHTVIKGVNQTGTAGRGRPKKKCHDNLRKTSRQLTTFDATFYDNFHLILPIDSERHKTS